MSIFGFIVTGCTTIGFSFGFLAGRIDRGDRRAFRRPVHTVQSLAALGKAGAR